MEFDVNQTLQLLMVNINIFWSWGVSRRINVENKGVLLKVNGNNFRGWVFITLDWSDTYTVDFINGSGEVLETKEMVYFDNLVEVIDVRVERIPEYKF